MITSKLQYDYIQITIRYSQITILLHPQLCRDYMQITIQLHPNHNTITAHNKILKIRIIKNEALAAKQQSR